MQCPEWMSGWGQGWGMHIHWLWAIPFIFIVTTAICFLFLLWRVGPRYMHPLSGWHMPHIPHMSFSAPESAHQILDRRYASGDITKEQYEEMKKNLQQWERKPQG